MDCLDIEDMRRRCNTHHHWMQQHPDAVAFSLTWADQNLEHYLPPPRENSLMTCFADSPTQPRSSRMSLLAQPRLAMTIRLETPWCVAANVSGCGPR